MNNLDLFITITWAIIGVMNIALALVEDGKVNVSSYFLCWFMLMLEIYINYFG